MPIVKLARHNDIPVEWLGDDYDMAKEISQSQGFVKSNPALSPVEKTMLAAGIPAVTPDNLCEWLNAESRQNMSAESKTEFEQKYSKTVFDNQLKEIIASLK